LLAGTEVLVLTQTHNVGSVDFVDVLAVAFPKPQAKLPLQVLTLLALLVQKYKY
jgi:hypothetical protein